MSTISLRRPTSGFILSSNSNEQESYRQRYCSFIVPASKTHPYALYLITSAMLSNECNKEYFLSSTLVVAIADCLRYSNLQTLHARREEACLKLFKSIESSPDFKLHNLNTQREYTNKFLNTYVLILQMKWIGHKSRVNIVIIIRETILRFYCFLE
jgi:hypothetical protein